MVTRTTLSITGYRFDDPGPYVYEAENDTLLSTTDFVLMSQPYGSVPCSCMTAPAPRRPSWDR